MTPEGQRESGAELSFRDPGGMVCATRKGVFRIVNAPGMGHLDAFLRSAAARKWADSGSLVLTAAMEPDAQRELLADPHICQAYSRIGGQAILEHERIPFPSFPYEWAPEMLHAAADLTLELALDLIPEGLGLKDGTPYNILFRGAQPVFVDVLSVERREAADPTWLPYAQFIRTFLLPLMANRHFGLRLDQALFMRRDGLEPEDVYRSLGRFERLLPRFLPVVTLPVWLGSRQNRDDASLYGKKVLRDAEKARFILESLLKGLRRKLRRFAPGPSRSAWAGYMDDGNNYTAEHFAAKETFVRELLEKHRPRSVLDVGCNTGHFSFMAARAGARVVAIDYDPVVAGRVWRQAAAERLDVLPLVVDLTRPTPGAGWRNREWPSFLERARGSFDAVLMLAVIHHMLVTERVPLDEIIDLAAELTTGLLIVEFVSPRDSMFRRLVRGREELYSGLNAEQFEGSCRRHFEIVASQHIPGTERWLYGLRRRFVEATT